MDEKDDIAQESITDMPSSEIGTNDIVPAKEEIGRAERTVELEADCGERNQMDSEILPITEEPEDINSEKVEQAQIQESMIEIDSYLKRIFEMSEKTNIDIREMRRLYHNEFSNRLQSMQAELEHYHELEKGRMYDTILSEIGKLYCENYEVVERIENERIQKQFRYMFMDMLQLLESYGASKQESNVGDMRNTKYCQVLERIQTHQPEQHDTIADSKSIGFYIENRALIKEMVDVYIYTESKNNNNKEC